MNIQITPRPLKGLVEIPSSKSLTHRALICASLANGTSILKSPLICDDTIQTINCLVQLGVDIQILPNEIIVNKNSPLHLNGRLDAKDSASTIRFLIPIISSFTHEYSFYASKRLLERLKTDDLWQLKGLHIQFQKDHLFISGKLDYPNIKLFQITTSQWISGILMSLPLIQLPINIHFSTEYYTDLTIQMMQNFGVQLQIEQSIKVKGFYQPQTITIEVDYSSMAYFLGMALFSKSIKIKATTFSSLQPDYRIFSLLEKMGVEMIHDEEWISCRAVKFQNTTLNLVKNPDLAPILAAVASVSGKTVRIGGLDSLQYKESNRLLAIKEALQLLGAEIDIYSNELIIQGKEKLLGGVRIPDYQDHRIVMSLIAIGSQIENPFIIEGVEAINKSFPNFIDLFACLGGHYEGCL